MRTIPLNFSGSKLAGAPPNGLPAADYWQIPSAFANVYGFSLRPWMSANDIGAGAGTGYKWSSVNGVPNPPGLFPLLALCSFENDPAELKLVADRSFHYFGGRRITSVDLFAPVLPLSPYANSLTGTLTRMGFVADVATSKGDVTFPSSVPQVRRFPLFFSDQWADTVNGRPYLQLTANAAWSGKLIDPMNFWGLSDDILPGAIGSTVGGFYIFEGSQRWRVVLKTLPGGGGVASDVTIWTRADQGDFFTAGLVANELVSAGDWTLDTAGNPVLVLERECRYNGEWIYLTAAGPAGPGAQNASLVYVTGGDIVVSL